MFVQRRECEGQERTLKVTEQGGRDADRIEDLSSVLMMEVARPLCQRDLVFVVRRGIASYRRLDDRGV
jgi:hypothetical protein